MVILKYFAETVTRIAISITVKVCHQSVLKFTFWRNFKKDVFNKPFSAYFRIVRV